MVLLGLTQIVPVMSWMRRLGDVVVVVVAVIVDLIVWGGARQLRFGGLLPFWIVPTLTVATYSTLLVRRRWPIEVFALQWTYGLAGLIVSGYEPFTGLLVALHAVACRTRTRDAWIVLLACAVPFGVDTYDTAVVGTHSSVVVRAAAIGIVLLTLVATAWGLGRLTYLANDRARLMQEQHAAEATHAIRTERLRLARELHDIVAHAVTAMILQAAGGRTLVGPDDDRIREVFTAVESVGVQAMNELHRLLGLLRSADPEHTGEHYDQQPRLRDIQALIDLSRAGGLDVHAAVEGAPGELDRSVDLAAYRIVQEALTNITKHAGRGAAVNIRTQWSGDRLTISVQNTHGQLRREHGNLARLSSGHGLQGLAERVSLIGGRLETGAVSDGFLVRAELPLRSAHQPGNAALHAESQ